MNNKNFYILHLLVNGIKNLDQDVVLKFYKSTVGEKIDIQDYNIKGIYGENGVGKSAIITAMHIFKNIVLNKRYLNDTDTRIALNNLVNKKTNRLFLECEFTHTFNGSANKNIFKYSVCIEKNNLNDFVITKEELFKKSTNNYVLIYSVNNGLLNLSLKSKDNEEFIKDKTQNLLLNSSLLSLIHSDDLIFDNEFINLEQVFYKAMMYTLLFFLNTIIHLDGSDLHETYVIKERLKEDPTNNEFRNLFNTISSPFIEIGLEDGLILKKDIKEYKKIIQKMYSFIKVFKEDLKNIIIDTKEYGEYYQCSLIFDYGDYKIHSEFESTGVKKLISLYQAFYQLNKGSVVFIDELDANLHDVYLCKLLEYMGENAKGQLCFTSHNIGPMEFLSKRKMGLDFLTRDKAIVSWIKNGNYSATKLYKEGMIKNSPFNIDSFDFLKMFGNE